MYYRKHLARISIMLAVALSTLAVSGMFVSFTKVYADHTCSISSHCWAWIERTVANSGNKESFKAVNLTVPSCSSSNKQFTVVTQWVVFNSVDFIEVGEGTGWLNNQCQSNDINYSVSIINNVLTWGTHGTLTSGTTYTFSMDDSATDKTWVIKRGSTTLRTVSSTPYSTGEGKSGVEQTHTSTTSIPQTQKQSISYYNNGWNLWLSNVDAPAYHSPLWRYVCTFGAWHEMNVGSGSVVAC